MYTLQDLEGERYEENRSDFSILHCLDFASRGPCDVWRTVEGLRTAYCFDQVPKSDP
jgi:hypothetical protein